MCSAQYQYRSGASHLERQHLQLFVHVAVKKNFVAASAGVKSCLALGLALTAGCLGMPSVLQAASARPRPSRFCFRNQGIEGDNDVLCLPRSAVGFGAKLRSHHKLAVRVQNEGSAACKEVACISSPRDRGRCTTEAIRAPKLGLPSRQPPRHPHY